MYSDSYICLRIFLLCYVKTDIHMLLIEYTHHRIMQSVVWSTYSQEQVNLMFTRLPYRLTESKVSYSPLITWYINSS